MADVTRDSYQDTKSYDEVTFQRGKDVLDAELNELQKIQRGLLTKGQRAALGAFVVSSGEGLLVTSDGITANTLTVKAGLAVAKGYSIHLAADVLITGLTTPGATRTDDVYVKIEEVEVTSSTDSLILVAALGETTVRKQLRATFVVDEGAAAPPASTTEAYVGGIQYVLLARIVRTAASTIPPITIFDMRLPYAGTQYKDASGFVRSHIDRNGFRAGRVIEFREDWRHNTVPQGWIEAVTGTGGIGYVAPSATLPFRAVELSVGAGAGTSTISTQAILRLNTDVTAMFEGIVRTGSSIDAGTSMRAQWTFTANGFPVGFTFDPDSSPNVRFFEGLAFSDTGVALAVSTTYRLRMEVIGDAHHPAANHLLRAWLNGVLVYNAVTTNAIGGNNLQFGGSLNNNAGASPYTFTFGPVNIVWNYVDTTDPF